MHNEQKTISPVDEQIDQAIIRGRIEAFEFMAKQFEVYADDNDEVMTRWRRSTPANKERSKVWRGAAAECLDYANTQKASLV